MSPVSVLFCMPGLLDDGRVTAYVMRYLQHMDGDAVHVDFLVRGMEKGAREEEARALGCRVYHVPPFWRNPIRHIADTKNVLFYGDYDAVEAHADAGNAPLMYLARRAGISVRVSMSHSVRLQKDNLWTRLLLRLARPVIFRNATHLFARSTLAGRFLYGKNAMDAGEVTIYKDAIRLDEYRFDPAVRAEKRERLHLANAYLIGHVERFEPRQNHEFLIDTFAILSRRMPEAMLVLVGEGPLYGDVIRRIRERGIEDQVRLMGSRDDVPELLSAFDCFVLPTKGEGLPVTVVEAQRNGLPCIVSLAVPTEACVADLTFVPLFDVEEWIAQMRAHAGKTRSGVPEEPFIECGFDIVTEAARRAAFYQTSVQEAATDEEDADSLEDAADAGDAMDADAADNADDAMDADDAAEWADEGGMETDGTKEREE